MDFVEMLKIFLEKIDKALKDMRESIIKEIRETCFPDIILSHTAQVWRKDKTYSARSLVVHRGGLWTTEVETAEEPSTDGSGWLCLMNGLHHVDFAVDMDNLRIRTLVLSMSNGENQEFSWEDPIGIHRGTHVVGEQYNAGDEVARDGSLWRAKCKTADVPPSENWYLCASKGQRGKRAKEEVMS